MSTAENTQSAVVGLSAGVKEVLASSLSTLGRLHNGEYVLNRHCLESIKDIIRFLRRDNDSYEIRRYLGQAKVVQNDLIHIIKVCPAESEDLFDLTVRLLTNLTNSVATLYGEEIPNDKIGRSIYMNLIEHLQDYKEAFYDIDFWNVICGKLTDMFEIDWSERSESQCLRVEKMLVLLRNVLQIPADPEREKITENDISVHDKILWSLRQSQILEFLLYLSSNKDESRYYLHLLEIFALILKEQNPKLLAMSEIQRSISEREKDMKELMALRDKEKMHKSKYKYTRTFDSTFVLKGLKSFSGRDMIYHGSLEDMKVSVVQNDKKKGKPRNMKMPVQSDDIERRSAFSARIFLKEFCVEFLNCSYNNLMSVVKEKLLAGKGLPNDETFYFWALKFFLEFNCSHNLDIKLISDSVNVQTFHYLQTSMDENFEKLVCEKKKRALWVKKLHLILKAYYSLLMTLKWMDSSKDESVRKMSSVLKSQIFYITEYRDMGLVFLTRYEPDLYSVGYLKDVIEVTHLSIKLLEDYTKSNKIVVRKKLRKKSKKKRKKKSKKNVPEPVYEDYGAIWDRIKDDVSKVLNEKVEFPDIPPFDVLLELTEEEQKEIAMKKIQKLLHENNIIDGIGLLRSAREVWPENDHFGSKDMSVDDETVALKEICVAELGNEKIPTNLEDDESDEDNDDTNEEDSQSDEDHNNVSEELFDIMNYKKQLVNKKVVEACAVLLKNYAKNSEFTNHCVIKTLFRIGWECGMHAMMYQASLFWTLLSIMNDKYKKYKEINDFTVHLMRKFQRDAARDKFTFIELLFWKDASTAARIQGDAELDDDYREKTEKRKEKEKEDEEMARLLGCDKEKLNDVIRVFESTDDDADDEAIERMREKNRAINAEKNQTKEKRRRKKKGVGEIGGEKGKKNKKGAKDGENNRKKPVSRRKKKTVMIGSDSGSDAEIQNGVSQDEGVKSTEESVTENVRRIDSDDESDMMANTVQLDDDKENSEPVVRNNTQKRSRKINSDSESDVERPVMNVEEAFQKLLESQSDGHNADGGCSVDEPKSKSNYSRRKIDSDSESDIDTPNPRIDAGKEFDKLLESNISDEEVFSSKRVSKTSSAKRRRCISSDSDMEESAETNSQLKRSKVIDSDSDEVQNSQ